MLKKNCFFYNDLTKNTVLHTEGPQRKHIPPALTRIETQTPESIAPSGHHHVFILIIMNMGECRNHLDNLSATRQTAVELDISEQRRGSGPVTCENGVFFLDLRIQKQQRSSVWFLAGGRQVKDGLKLT